MSKIATARAEFAKGGTPRLIHSSRIWLASKIYPGQIPPVARLRQEQRARAKARKATKARHSDSTAAATRLSPLDVKADEATAWFDSRRQGYEQLARALLPYVDRDGLVLDVGANIGYFTKVLGETIGLSGTVHLFEPVPHLARLCRETLHDVPFSTVVHEFGLSNEDGRLDLFTSVDGNLGWNTMVADQATDDMTRLQIEVRAFDGVGIDETPTLVKIDVEGAEFRVLGGMLSAFKGWSPLPVILCEIGWGRSHPQWEEELAVFEQLRQLGYRAVDLDGNPINLTELDRTTDVIFLADSDQVGDVSTV